MSGLPEIRKSERRNQDDLHKTDPEFAKQLCYFVLNEVVKEEKQQLESSTRYLVILAVLIGSGMA